MKKYCGDPNFEEYQPVREERVKMFGKKGYDWNVLENEYWVTALGEVLYPARGEMELKTLWRS